MATNLVTQIEIGRAQLLYNSADLGYTEDALVKVTKKYKDITTSQTLDQVLEKKLVAIEATIEATLKETVVSNMALNFPWYSSGAIPLAPTTFGVGLYQFAKALVLHPLENGVGTTEDVAFTKAVPIGDYEVKYDGKTEKMRKVVFFAFPDRTSLPSGLSLGTIG